ncbi:MAG TPA: Yip1 family protein [Chitinophagaceae bacterium]|nr:Yip1 family protein [Chitinophagaceae bacterium]
MKELFHYYWLTFTHPAKGFKELINDRRHLQFGFCYIMIPIAGYTLMYIFLTIAGGAPSVFTPWLNIPKDQYYSINRYLLAPSMLLCWIMAASFIHLVSRLFGGKGSFEQTLAVAALSISVAMWGGLVHDLPMSFFSAIKVIDARQHELDMNSPTIWRTLLWTCYSVYFIAFFCLFSIMTKVVQQLKWPAAIFAGVTGFIIFQLLFFVFNR